MSRRNNNNATQSRGARNEEENRNVIEEIKEESLKPVNKLWDRVKNTPYRRLITIPALFLVITFGGLTVIGLCSDGFDAIKNVFGIEEDEVKYAEILKEKDGIIQSQQKELDEVKAENYQLKLDAKDEEIRQLKEINKQNVQKN